MIFDKRGKNLLAFGFLILCYGCSSGLSIKDETMKNTAEALLDSPAPKPEFIGQLESSDKEMCVTMLQEAIRQLGEGYSLVRERLFANTVITIDGETISIGEEGIWFHGVNLPDSVSGTTQICVAVELADGTHLATFKTKLVSGEEIFYQWAFHLD